MAQVSFKDVDKILGQLIGVIEDRKREIMEPVEKIIVEDTRLRFKLGVDPQGRPWAPLKEATLRSRRRKGRQDQPVLSDSRTLRNSIESSSTNDEVIIGTNVEYAKYHQEGTSRMPQRKILGLSESVRRRIRSLIQRVLREKGKA